ncbi:hypothetical protein [Aquimarina sp. SS2-1]|uniref:hypothetical protein n=1 Tax=Aquimarina besae TaxID=3342247 RepID=UPI00366C53F1
MKKIKIHTVILGCLFTLLSCSKDNLDNTVGNQKKIIETENREEGESSFFKENVALIDSRIRSISEEAYVRELVFVNFSQEEPMLDTVTFDNTSFFDDGSYNDLKANDGIYTSAAIFKHSKRVPYFKEFEIVSVMKEVVVDSNFKHSERLKELSATYDHAPFLNNLDPDNVILEAGIGVSIECDVEFGTCGCYADQWGLCDCCCVTVSNCKVTVSAEVGLSS